ncbi:alpha/beta fold hydrolase [Leucobacter aridicollis]|uniref:alpha/beta fold hydrolase n=1 Tax=Leucobacter aridicollis TaxID=283878 RepID=UPI002104B622|nr:alpha/beta fold hydrolase [Leucobacter aridicollis]UTX51915.1 alpha/beta fold hydrolase [Leucobacter aridicollis]
MGESGNRGLTAEGEIASGGDSRHALVFGASGLVGRHLVLKLLGAGADVTVAVRSEESGAKVVQWVREHGGLGSVQTAVVDFAAPEILAGGPTAFASVTEIHNCAGLYRFGMSVDEARDANVGIVERVVEFASQLPRLGRLLHISGYRVGGQDPSLVPWSDTHRSAVYGEAGAYEGSKMESDAVFQARATELGLAWTVVNPSSVIGDSVTGESDQLIGLATTVGQLYRGETAALPGGDDVFLPVVTVDYFAAFMERAATDPGAAGRAYWVLDDRTPPLGDMLAHVGRHLGAPVPRVRVPVAVIKRLPQRITKADPETLTFMSADRYPTDAANELAARHGLLQPDVRVSLERWADYLAAHRFGAQPGDDRRYVEAGGIRTFTLGAGDASGLILPGLPINADTWADVASDIDARVVDLPGLGLSGATGITDWGRWLPEVLPTSPVHLVGHSLGAAAAVTAADRFPGRVSALTLVSPFFLQSRSVTRHLPRPLIAAYMRGLNGTGLSRLLTGTDAEADALESSVSDLRRGASRRVAAQLRQTASLRWRAELRVALARFEGPVTIITGAQDPLDSALVAELASRPNIGVVAIPGAGHHPHLTHRALLSEALVGGRESQPGVTV